MCTMCFGFKPAEIAVWSLLVVVCFIAPMGIGFGADVTERPAAEAESSTAAHSKPLKSGSKYLLRYKFRPSEFIRYEVTQRARIEVQYGETKQVTRNEARTRTQMRVVAVNRDGQIILEPVIEHVHMEAATDGDKPIIFDSEAPADSCPAQFRPIRQTIGRALTRATIAADGTLIQVQMLDRAEQASFSTPSKPPARPSQNFLVVLPKEPVAVGETWTEDFEIQVDDPSTKLKRSVTLRRRYRLEAVEGSIARISYKTALLTPLSDPAIDAQLIQWKPTGTVLFDIDRGLVLLRRAEHDETVVGAFGPRTRFGWSAGGKSAFWLLRPIRSKARKQPRLGTVRPCVDVAPEMSRLRALAR
ncbi:MAG: hypothetical protein GXP27_00960 [Planctomycetes bacterium]|nr:hypothetical protein [Planctomycetota bacterium]